ncbi:MAG: peptidase M23 [Alphaproteobacteria bacterium]|nr:peptidase M23 [Alphaproteobacteria bacterium]
MSAPRILTTAIGLSIFCPALAFAQSVPTPPSKAAALAGQQERLDAEQRKERELRAKLAQVEKELAQTRSELVSLAADMRENEMKSQSLLKRISGMEDEAEDLAGRLKADYGSIGNLVLALQRLKRVPPEALLVRPGAPIDTARSAMLLQTTLPALYDRANRVKRDLRRLEEIRHGLEEDRQDLEREGATLAVRRKAMDSLLARREKLYAGTHEEHERQQATVRAIAAQARDLRDLVNRLDEDRKRAETRALSQNAVMMAPPPRSDRAAPRASGPSQLPATGIIRIGYGQKDEFGAESKGITIDGQPDGLVTSPLDGTVRFAGPFKRFGQMVIIEHEGGYHSLIAGLAKIDTVVGRKVASGEPVGLLSGHDQGGPPSLYFELRYNSEPVNPSRKFTIPN